MKSTLLILLAGLGFLAGAWAQPFTFRDPAFGPNPVAASGETLLLDEIGTSASLAYSVSRKLRSAYGGGCVDVVRASDGTQETIGFSGSLMDTNALASFCSGTYCYVVRIHDQGSLDVDLVQSDTNSAPLICTNGIICVGSNGRVMTIFATGGNDQMQTASASVSVPLTEMIVFYHDEFTANRVVYDGGTASNVRMRQTSTSTTSSAMRLDNGGTGQNSSTSLNADTWYLATTTWLGSTGAETIRINNGSEEINLDVGDNAVASIRLSSSVGAAIQFSEMIVWPADLSAGDETDLRDNINAFFALW